MEPTLLHSAVKPTSSLIKNWYVIHTKSRQESRASRNLEAWGVETFVPWLGLGPNSRDQEALFPGYLFANFSLQDAHKISFTRGVLYIVSFGGVFTKVEDEIMAEIRGRTDNNGVVNIRTILEEGDRVVIRSGPLQNLVGVFEKEIPGTQRIQILLTTLSFNARVRLSISEVDKLHCHAAA